MKTRMTIKIVITAAALLLTACGAKATPGETISVFAGEKLTPYATSTLTPENTATPQDAPTATLALTYTATPLIYAVKADDTMFIIAYKYGISVDALKAANPDINPYLLGVGMTLNIPAPTGGGEMTATAPISTPFPMVVSQTECSPSITGGFYCFAQLENEQTFDLSNISADFMITNPATGEVVVQEALVPLSSIAAGKTLPIFAYIESAAFNNPQVSVQLTSAMNSTASTAPITLSEPQIDIDEGGMYATVNVQAVYSQAEISSASIWLAAVAYDAQGDVAGIRRYQCAPSGAGEVVNITLYIYSVNNKIDKVELFGEAVP